MDNQFEPVQSQSIWTIILPTIIITALIVGGGVWYWQKSVLEKEKEALQQQIEELENRVSGLLIEQEIINTSDWEIYGNEYGFELKYPGDWEKSENYFERYKFRLTLYKQDEDQEKSIEQKVEYWISFRNYFLDEESIGEIKENPQCAEHRFMAHGEVGGFNAIRCSLADRVAVYLVRDNENWQFNYTWSSVGDPLKFESIFNQILSTFKFIK